MDMPTPGAAHARLHALAGHWGGQETVHPTPWDAAGGMADAVVLNRVVLDGFAVVQDYEQYRGGRRSFSGHGIFWWDAAANQYVMTWFDSMMGMPAEYRGEFDGDVLRLTHAMPGGGFARCSFDCGLPDEYVFFLEMSRDGQIWTPAVEGAYETVKMPARTAPMTKSTRPGPGKAATKRAAATKPAKSAAARKTAVRKASAKKMAVEKTAAKRTVVNKPPAKRPAATRAAAVRTPALARTARKAVRVKK